MPDDRRPAAPSRLLLPAPLSIRSVNSYLLPGEPLTVVDPGPQTEEAYTALVAALSERGYRPDDIEQVVVTHTHLDHFGLARRLHDASGAAVIAHASARQPLVDFPSAWQTRLDLHTRAAVAAVVPQPLLERSLGLLRAQADLASSVPAGALQTVEDGARLPVGDRRWTVVHTPGHAADHIALYGRRDGTLIGGDLLLRLAPTPPLLAARRPDGTRPNVLAELVASWRRVGRLGLAVVWPGHGGPIRAHRLLIARRLAEVRNQLREARSALADGPLTVWQLARALELPDDPEWLHVTLGWSVALLDWLVEREWAAREVDGGRVRFQSVSPKDE